MRPGRFLVVAATALAAACAPVGPNYERPSYELPRAYPGAAATPDAPVVHVAREHLGDLLGMSFAVITRWWPAPASGPQPLPAVR